MARRPTHAPADAVWEAFARRYAGNPMLEQDPLYALSEPVLDALVEEAPDFFAGDQEWFERDLARTAVHGFFLRRVVGGADSLPFSQPEPLQAV